MTQIKRGDLRGLTYLDKQGRTIRILGADMLWPDGSKMLVEREDKQWGVDTEELLHVVNSAQNAENSPQPFKGKRRMNSRGSYQHCSKCGVRWYANEVLPCPNLQTHG